MLKFEGKVSRALKRQRIRLQLPMPALPKEEENQRQHESSTSRKTKTSSRSSSQRKGEKAKNTPEIAPRSQALLHKRKNQQRKIKARARAARNVICHADIMDNPKAMAKAGEVWTQIGSSRQEYQSLVDIAFIIMGGNKGLAETLADDEERGDWLESKPNYMVK